jgi:hypothetical protein
MAGGDGSSWATEEDAEVEPVGLPNRNTREEPPSAPRMNIATNRVKADMTLPLERR